ncbi:hypothetical protein DSM112329_02132 [Paraconexibacter sp. AEG42_29]|uniref:Uncharacterized protein n=1 Tax=Paraconexibacter sp. AEG42_29 TaxID=2997339 RepID=A0AAU7AUJ9_9ACTN
MITRDSGGSPARSQTYDKAGVLNDAGFNVMVP